ATPSKLPDYGFRANQCDRTGSITPRKSEHPYLLGGSFPYAACQTSQWHGSRGNRRSNRKVREMSVQAVAFPALGPVAAPNSSPNQGAAEPVSRALSEAWNLVHAAQAGDSAAFGQLYDRYVDTVFRYVLFRMSDRDLAEDVTSETFLRALRRISTVSYQGRDVGAWFITIARNLVFDHVKSSRFRCEVVTDEVTEPGQAAGRTQSQDTSEPEQRAMTNV